MGNVLISFDTVSILRRRGISAPEDIELFAKTVFRSDVWQDYDRGTVTKDAFVPLIDALPVRLRALADDMLIRHIFAAENMPPIKATEALVKKAKDAGYAIYLLSNAGQDFYEYRRGIPALRYFDGIFISSDYKLLKPEREIYLAFLKKFSLAPEDCVFVDDMQVNIDGAKAVGMDGICFNAAKEDIAVLCRELARRGIEL